MQYYWELQIIILFMDSRPGSAKRPKSSFQSRFQNEQLFKRNKRYVDIQSVNSMDKKQSILRRKPTSSEQDSRTGGKLHNSFLNTTAEFNSRIEKDIDKYRSRLTFSFQAPETPRSLSVSNVSETSPKKAKCFSMSKITSREYHDQIRNKPCNDERLFNNFQHLKIEAPLACNFQKMDPHKLDYEHKHLNDIYYDVKEPYEKYYYKRTTNETKVNYKLEKKMKSERYFFIPKRPENLPSTDINPEDVDRGLKVATNFKGNNISQSNIDNFYCNSGKKLPPQLEMRHMNQLTNHWKASKPNNLDFDLTKMKEDMKAERVRKIKAAKKAQYDRKQLCDDRFFKRHREQLFLPNSSEKI